MVKSRREYMCSFCAKKYLRWEGICSNCSKQGTIEEFVLLPPKSRATLSQRALGERAKRSERTIARTMTAVDGADPAFARIASSTGRTGHITQMQVDAVSRSYVTENKNRIIPGWMVKAWIIINQRAIDFHKEPFLHIDPPNMPKTIPLNGKNESLSTMAIISQKHHEHLVARDRALSEIESLVLMKTNMGATMIVAEITKILRK